MSSPNDWLHINQRNHNPTGDNRQDMLGRHHAVPDALHNGTNSGSENFSYSSTDQMNSSSTNTHLNPERRVSKPIRRRRAPRGAPVTLLNTDASNFRAMVQQLTGVPNPPFSLASINNHPDHAAAGVLGTNLNFQLPRDNWFQHHQDPSSNSVIMHQQQQQQQQFMFALNNNYSTVTTSGREQVGSNHQDQLPGLPNFDWRS